MPDQIARDSGITPTMRADRVLNAVMDYQDRYEPYTDDKSVVYPETIVDMMADMLHFAEAIDLDVALIATRAVLHWTNESESDVASAYRELEDDDE